MVLGNVGLPLLLEINKKFIAYGFDIDDDKIKLLKEKRNLVFQIFQEKILVNSKSGENISIKIFTR